MVTMKSGNWWKKMKEMIKRRRRKEGHSSVFALWRFTLVMGLLLCAPGAIDLALDTMVVMNVEIEVFPYLNNGFDMRSAVDLTKPNITLAKQLRGQGMTDLILTPYEEHLRKIEDKVDKVLRDQ
jgi:hypothetical protein